MSKMGNHVVEMQSSEHYCFGWESAERGDPQPEAGAMADIARAALAKAGGQHDGR